MNQTPRRLHIKKYPNRRFYDATRSRHVTLQEVYQLVRDGFSVTVTDSRNNDDITNIILMQILLEKDPPKLEFFPSWILHSMIRSSNNAVRAFLEQSFGPFARTLSQSQRGLDEVMDRAMRGEITTPADWAGVMMRAFQPPMAQPTGQNGEFPEPSSEPPPSMDAPDALESLQKQIEMLSRKLSQLELGSAREEQGESP